jgi:hypothetical protein
MAACIDGRRFLDGAGDAADEAAAADGHHHCLKLRDLLQKLKANGSLAGHDAGVVEGMDEGEMLLVAQTQGLGA